MPSRCTGARSSPVEVRSGTGHVPRARAGPGNHPPRARAGSPTHVTVNGYAGGTRLPAYWGRAMTDGTRTTIKQQPADAVRGQQPWFAQAPGDVLTALSSDADRGLGHGEAATRLSR